MGGLALSENITGNNNTAIGYEAGYGATGSGNVFIGYRAGKTQGGSNKLVIANSGLRSKKLIWGSFSNGNVFIKNNITAGKFVKRSDARLKADIKDIDQPLETVLKLEGKHYRLKEANTEDMGLLAQDLEKVLPELVSESDDGYKAISYESLTALLIEALKEQQGQMEEQKAQMTAQQSEITSLREENTSLKTHMSDQEVAMVNQQKAIDTLMTRMANLESTSLVQN